MRLCAGNPAQPSTSLHIVRRVALSQANIWSRTGETMEIGMIGAGNIGVCLARKLKDAGHTVRIANSRGPETLADLAQEVGATAVSVVDVAKQSDVLIISVPMKAIQQF